MKQTDRMVWGWVAHLIADWIFQNDWMAVNKANLRHPAGYVHAGIHGAVQVPVFKRWALPIAISHLLIDTRKPVAWFSRRVRQTQPEGRLLRAYENNVPLHRTEDWSWRPVYDVGTEVRFWVDQVWHVAVLAIASWLKR